MCTCILLELLHVVFFPYTCTTYYVPGSNTAVRVRVRVVRVPGVHCTVRTPVPGTHTCTGTV